MSNIPNTSRIPDTSRAGRLPAVRTTRFALLVLMAQGCATAGSTLGSGVGDRLLDEPPYYAGAAASAVAAEVLRLGHLPVMYQRGAIQPSIFDPSLTPEIQDFLDEMTRFLDGLGVSERLVEGGRLSAVAHEDTTRPPDVQFGCVTDTGFEDDDCAEPEDGMYGRGGQWMRLAVARPAPEWAAWMGQVMTDWGVDRTLVVTLEVGRYFVRQEGFRGTKVVGLGTRHRQELPWLTSLEVAVPVLQLTGALVGPDGRAVRIGAEGLLARRTNLALSGFGAEALITDRDIAELRTARREDLPGRPLVWEEGLRALVAGLTGRDPGR